MLRRCPLFLASRTTGIEGREENEPASVYAADEKSLEQRARPCRLVATPPS